MALAETESEDYKVNKRPKDDTSDDETEKGQVEDDYKSIKFKITSLWKRSEDSEGNPMHKAQTRERIDIAQQPVEVIPIEGITCSFDWHRDKQVKERNWVPDPQNRAILIQTYENKCILQSKFPIFQEAGYENMFGENIVMQRIYDDEKEKEQDKTQPVSACNTFCIGDILEINRDGNIVCKLQISSPRWPCYKLDKRCGIIRSKDTKQESVQKYIVDTSLGGIFCNVLIKGDICEGDIITIKERINPSLSLGYVAKLCYGGDVNKRTCLINEFQGNQKEFERLIDCKELSTFEWKDRLLRWDKKRKQKQNQPDEADPPVQQSVATQNESEGCIIQ